MKLLFVNNVRLELLQSLNETATTMLVSKAAEPFNNPIIDSQLPDFQELFIRLTIVDDLDPTQIEIVTVTGIVEETASTYQFDIVRGEENTQAQSFGVGSIVYMSHTAESINRPRPKFLDDIGDVIISGQDVGDMLYWDGNNWVNQKPDLDELNNVISTNPQSGQFLIWDGSTWINATVTTTLEQATDTDITNLQEDQLLVWNGIEWKNCTIDYFKDSSVTATIGTFGDQAIPVETDVIGVISENILLSGNWKTITKPEGAIQIDLRVSDFGTSPGPTDSILNGNHLVITNVLYNSGTSNDLVNFLLEKGKVLSIVITSTDNTVEWLSLSLDGRVVVSTEKNC